MRVAQDRRAWSELWRPSASSGMDGRDDDDNDDEDSQKLYQERHADSRNAHWLNGGIPNEI